MYVSALRTTLNGTPKQVREALMNTCAQMLACYRQQCASPSSAGELYTAAARDLREMASTVSMHAALRLVLVAYIARRARDLTGRRCCCILNRSADPARVHEAAAGLHQLHHQERHAARRRRRRHRRAQHPHVPRQRHARQDQPSFFLPQTCAAGMRAIYIIHVQCQNYYAVALDVVSFDFKIFITKAKAFTSCDRKE